MKLVKFIQGKPGEGRFAWAIKSKLSTLQNDGGRVTIWTAKALKARLLLTRASEKNDVDMYGQAYDLAKDVIENGPFELVEDFASIWDMKNMMETLIKK